MRALLAALLTAATLPVLPASDASKLVADVAGKPARPVVLHFWATWCEACRDEFPSIRRELLALPGRGVGVLLVSIDRPDHRAQARRMLREYKLLSLPAVLLDAPEPDPVARAIGEPTWDGTLPATFVFDGNGKLSKSFVGRADPAALAAAVRAVKR
ncbi:MAG: TlpA family protein disulfide reductase [Deltaproteobacteria bacterium]|nr:MAG: TlpA family protein disulfide reductase [Deltaproteobacteria bacterium]TMA72158.1 MAG: TlpA family protein disulfide reductase [Deltaproteobacteria bacterium]TMB32980.1 MAG: TlpA family protein disulfide reductase [Deltaproteobacteria bacterium]